MASFDVVQRIVRRKEVVDPCRAAPARGVRRVS